MSDVSTDKDCLCSNCDAWCAFLLPCSVDNTASGGMCAPATDEDWERTRNLMRATIRLLESKNI